MAKQEIDITREVELMNSFEKRINSKFLIAYDCHNDARSEEARKQILKFIVKNDGVPLKCPVKSTIVFSSYKTQAEWRILRKGEELLENMSFSIVRLSEQVKEEDYILDADKTLFTGFNEAVISVYKELEFPVPANYK